MNSRKSCLEELFQTLERPEKERALYCCLEHSAREFEHDLRKLRRFVFPGPTPHRHLSTCSKKQAAWLVAMVVASRQARKGIQQSEECSRHDECTVQQLIPCA